MNYSVSGITMPVIASRCAKLGAREQDGRWGTGGRRRKAEQLPQTSFPDTYLTGRVTARRGRKQGG